MFLSSLVKYCKQITLNQVVIKGATSKSKDFAFIILNILQEYNIFWLVFASWTPYFERMQWVKVKNINQKVNRNLRMEHGAKRMALIYVRWST